MLGIGDLKFLDDLLDGSLQVRGVDPADVRFRRKRTSFAQLEPFRL